MIRNRWLLGPALVLAAFVAIVGCLDGAQNTQAKSAPAGNSDAVAVVDGQTITLEQVDQQGMSTNAKVYQALYDARKAVLDSIVEDHLLEKEAKAQGISKDALVEREITAKTQQPSDTQVEAFYNQNKARMGGKTLDQMKPQIKNYLAANTAATARKTYIDSLKKKSTVRMMLEPPRVAVTVAANDPIKGPKDAPIRIVEFSDFQ